MQRPIRPTAFFIPSIVPAIVRPIFDRDDQIEGTVAVVIDVPPLIVPDLEHSLGLADLSLVNVRRQRQFDGAVNPGLQEFGVLESRSKHSQTAIDIRWHRVVLARSEPLRRFEDRQLLMRTADVLEQVRPVVRLVGTDHDQVMIAVSVDIPRHGPRPQANAQIDNQTGVVVLDSLQAVGGECVLGRHQKN